ncbi:MAG: DUF58 domain-containing protein [Paenibacillus sp.]|uniref:DUF58 domain-containing protein n=1 Tax=Paenibacillus sp. TaxID=58172 RepID=UPI002902AFDF|nr:DUF58 domain-containing protein [Paenibacillus sp.]MDU2239833.1 DUF58 domain-containing protein [Paenibacillus sp.]
MKRAGWAWPVAIAFAGALGGWYAWRGGASALFLLLLAGWIMLQGALVQVLGPKRFKVERAWQPAFPVAGEPVAVTLTVRCEGGLPPVWLQVEDELAWTAAGQGTNRPGVRGGSLFFSGFRRDYRVTYTIQGLPRGIYKDTSVRLTWGDPFGWFKRSRKAAAAEVMVIHPLPLAADPPEAEERGEQEGGGAWQPQLVMSSPAPGRLRPYAPGDPLRRIHWKYSAKKGELLSRIPEEQGVMPRYLLLSAQQGDYASPVGFELAVSAAATWLAREAGNSDAGELRFSHGAMAGACRVTGREGMMGGLEQLAGLRLGNGLSAGELLRRDWSEVLSQGQSLTVITGTLTPELAGDLLHLAELGVAAEVWCAGGLGGSGQPIQLAARLRERGVTVADLTLYRTKSRRKGASGHASA